MVGSRSMTMIVIINGEDFYYSGTIINSLCKTFTLKN